MKVNKTFRINQNLLKVLKEISINFDINQIDIIEDGLRKELTKYASMGLIRNA